MLGSRKSRLLRGHVNINEFNKSFSEIFPVYNSSVTALTPPNITMTQTVEKIIFERPLRLSDEFCVQVSSRNRVSIIQMELAFVGAKRGNG